MINSDLGSFLSNFSSKNLPKNSSVFQNGDSQNHICFLRAGLVREYTLNVDGEIFILNLYLPESFFPIRSNNQSFFETIIPSVISQVPITQWHEFLLSHPEILLDIVQQVSVYLETFSQRMSLLAKGSVQKRILSIISHLNNQLGQPTGHNGSRIINYPLTHREIAAWAGTTRESASIEINKLEKAGLIKFFNRKIVITDKEKFMQIDNDSALPQ